MTRTVFGATLPSCLYGGPARPAAVRPRHRRLAGAVLAFAAFVGGPAMAQTYSIVVTTVPDLGTVIPGETGATVFRFSPGGVVAPPLSGTGVRRPGGSVRGLVTITCSGGSGNDCGSAVAVRLGSIGTPTGKAGALSNFTVLQNAGALAGATGANPVAFTVTPQNKNSPTSFYFGADIPISDSGAGTVGAATSAFYVHAALSPATPSTGITGAVTATTWRGLSFTGAPTLRFGGIVRPTAGNATVTLNPALATNPVSVTGNALLGGGSPARAAYNITGEGGQAITVTVPSSFVMNRSGGGTTPITVNLTTTPLPTALSGSVGSAGTAGFFAGGDFTISNTTQTGAYSGTYDVTVAYN